MLPFIGSCPRPDRLIVCLAAVACVAMFPARASAVLLLVVLEQLTLFQIVGLDFELYATSETATLRIDDTDTGQSGVVDVHGQTEGRSGLTLWAVSRVDPRLRVRIDIDVAPLRGPAKGRRVRLNARGTADSPVGVTDPALAALQGPLTFVFRLESEIVDPRTGNRRTAYHLVSVRRGSKAHDVTGAWRGLLQDAGERDLVALDLLVRSQRERQFAGELQFGRPDADPQSRVFRIHGIVAASGETVFHGKSDEGKISGHASLHDFRPADILDGRLEVKSPGGSIEGAMLLLNVGSATIASHAFDDVYLGQYDAGDGSGSKRIELELHSIADEHGAPTTRVEGTVLLEHPSSGTLLNFQLVAKSDGNLEVVAIAAGVEGRLVLTGSATPNEQPERIIGTLRFVQNDGTALEATYEVVLPPRSQ